MGSALVVAGRARQEKQDKDIMPPHSWGRYLYGWTVISHSRTDTRKCDDLFWQEKTESGRDRYRQDNQAVPPPPLIRERHSKKDQNIMLPP